MSSQHASSTTLMAIVASVSVGLCLACSALNYPTPETSEDTVVNNGLEELLNAQEEEPLGWSDLTRLAREHRQQGELDRASERLAQAAILVGDLPPNHAQRRTVFGLRARLAMKIAAEGDLEAADDLADQLFAEAEAEPEVGGAALVSLAVSVADRREEAAQESGAPESQLELLRIALAAAQAGSIDRDRMNLALRVAGDASREENIELARMAIDQALSDAEHLIPSNKQQVASIQLEHARIALASGDFDTAKKSATAANRLIDKTDANASTRGIAEATLAEILAQTGEAETALVIATGAKARLGAEKALTPYARRRVLASLARVEASLGDRPSARQHAEQALSIPEQDLRIDTDLVRQLTRELAEWNQPQPPPEPDSAPVSQPASQPVSQPVPDQASDLPLD